MREAERFRQQFTNYEWQQLISNERFKLAWDAGDVIKAGELVGSILIGHGSTRKEREQLRKEYQKGKALDEFLS